MKKIIVLLTLAYGICAQAGAQLDIPVELMALDNQGRSMFIQNALTKIGVTTGTYEKLESIIIGGENTVQQENKGAYIAYFATLRTSMGVHKCEQRLVLGALVEERPDLVGADPVVCQQ